MIKKMTYPIMINKIISYIAAEYCPIDAEIQTGVQGVSGETSWAHMHAYRFAHAIALVSKYTQPGDLLVDVGAYPGTLLRLLKEVMGYQRLVGIGLSFNDDFVKQMKTFGIDFVPCNIDPTVCFTSEERLIDSRFHLQDSSASAVFFMETIEHVYNVENVLAEIRRILKPGGIVYCTTNNISHLLGFSRLLQGRSNLDTDLNSTSLLVSSQWRGHVRFYSLGELEFLFAKTGFNVIEANYVEPYFMVGSRNFKRGFVYTLAKTVLHNFGGRFRSHIEVVCAKKG